MGCGKGRFYMIIKLMPDQIAKLWDSIRYGIMNVITPTIGASPENVRNMLAQLLKQDMQCWCVYGEDKTVYGYVITSIFINSNTGSRTLIIDSLYVYEKMPIELWDNGFKALEQFAQVNNCKWISAYTSNPNVISVAKKYNFNDEVTYLVKEIGD